jgi:hypothetical protein
MESIFSDMGTYHGTDRKMIPPKTSVATLRRLGMV